MNDDRRCIMKIIRIKQRNIYLTICLVMICVLSTGLSIVPRAVDYKTQEVAADTESVDLPIIMYHSILKDPGKAGDYVVSPDTLESDLKYLKDNGYTFILSQDLIDYVYNGGFLPERPVILTFDDGYYNNHYYATEILKKYNAKAIISPICAETVNYTENPNENPNYGYCSVDNLTEMSESGIWEIANHSYDLHEYGSRQGSKIKQYEDASGYKDIFEEDTLKAQGYLEDETGCKILAYTYPFGAFCKQSEEFLQELGYKVTYITQDKNNTITRSPECLYKLSRYNRPAGISTAQFMQKIQPKTP